MLRRCSTLQDLTEPVQGYVVPLGFQQSMCLEQSLQAAVNVVLTTSNGQHAPRAEVLPQGQELMKQAALAPVSPSPMKAACLQVPDLGGSGGYLLLLCRHGN